MSTVDEIVDAIKDLSPEKRDEVLHRLGSLLSLNQPNSKSLNRPIKRARSRRPPIQIKGKPISETVIEDRR